MQLHQIKPIHKPKVRRRVGRGGKRGTYSGRGQKGQNVRAGRKMVPALKEWIKKYPKLRGYRFELKENPVAILNISDISGKINESETINPKMLVEKRLVRRVKGKIPVVKILGGGDVKKKLVFENCLFSKSAKEKIEKAGGEIK